MRVMAKEPDLSQVNTDPKIIAILNLKVACKLLHLRPPTQYEEEQVVRAVEGLPMLPYSGWVGIVCDLFSTLRGWEIPRS